VGYDDLLGRYSDDPDDWDEEDEGYEDDDWDEDDEEDWDEGWDEDWDEDDSYAEDADRAERYHRVLHYSAKV
jgi:hypothetical protein